MAEAGTTDSVDTGKDTGKDTAKPGGKDTVANTILVATLLCICCSVCVSVAAVYLQPAQERNRTLDRKRNILTAAGLYERGMDVEQAFGGIEARLVDFETGAFVDATPGGISPGSYDQRKAAKDPLQNVEIPQDIDIAAVKRRAKIGIVYVVRDAANRIEKLILPVHGLGLWGTMYGFLAIAGDLKTVSGFTFYEHIETPGLGGEITNPRWNALWPGKRLFDDAGQKIIIQVLKGKVDRNRPEAIHQVDGLAGATLTTRGVHNLLHYWLGSHGYGPLLAKLRERSSEKRDG